MTSLNETLTDVGTKLGSIFDSLGTPLMTLLIYLGIAAGIIGIFMAIASRIKDGFDVAESYQHYNKKSDEDGDYQDKEEIDADTRLSVKNKSHWLAFHRYTFIVLVAFVVLMIVALIMGL